MPKYSIIVPVYNTGENLKKCVESLKKQTFSDFEAIFVDDCSDDGSYDLCKKVSDIDDRFITIKQEKNLGQSAARNKGIKIAKGDYIIFVDSDDYIDYNLLSDLEKHLINNNYDLITWGMYDNIIKKDGTIRIKESVTNYLTDYYAEEINSENIYNLWIKTFFMSPCNKLYKSSIIKNNSILFNEKCVEFEDLVFNIEYCRNIKNYLILKKPYYYYVFYEGQVSAYKRKWESVKPFEVSHIVYDKTASYIIDICNGNNELDYLMIYSYVCYGKEIEYAYFMKSKRDFEKTVHNLVNDKKYIKMLGCIRDKTLLKIVLPIKILCILKQKFLLGKFMFFLENKIINKI